MGIGRESKVLSQVLLLYCRRIFLLQSYLLGSHTRHLCNLLLKATYSRLMSVLVDDVHKGILAELELRLVQTMLFKLLRHEVPLCNLKLLLREISRNIDHLHTVLKCRMDVLDVVGCCYEQYVREIIINIKIVIVERCILLWIKRFKKS